MIPAFLSHLFRTRKPAPQPALHMPPVHNDTIVGKSALTLRPKPAFFDWIATVAPHHPLGWSAERLIASDESIAWIIPSDGDLGSYEDFQEYLNSYKPAMLRSELRAVISDQTLWPEVSVRTFDSFFDLQVHSHVASIKHLTPW